MIERNARLYTALYGYEEDTKMTNSIMKILDVHGKNKTSNTKEEHKRHNRRYEEKLVEHNDGFITVPGRWKSTLYILYKL